MLTGSPPRSLQHAYTVTEKERPIILGVSNAGNMGQQLVWTCVWFWAIAEVEMFVSAITEEALRMVLNKNKLLFVSLILISV